MEIRAYLRSTTPTGKLTESSNAIVEDGVFILYPEEALRQAYLKYKAELKGLFEEKAEVPPIEEFRFTFEDELVETYYDNMPKEDDDDDD
jgi:hypothetical protein